MTTKATLGVVDPAVLARANHTGEQAISTVTSLQAELDTLQTNINNLNIESGTWAPTETAVSNVVTVSTGGNGYFRVADVVHCFGFIVIDPNTAGVTRADISLPVASAMTSSGDLRGVFSTQSAQRAGAIYANTTDDLARFDITFEADASQTFSYQFSYKVL